MRSIAAGVDNVKTVGEFSVYALRIVPGHVEKRLGDRQRSAKFVGCIGRESPLFGDLGFELREHGVEAVGEFVKLVPATG